MTHPDTPIRPLYKRGHILLAAFAAGCLFILAMTLLLGKSRAGGIFLDTRTTLFVYPFTIQNMEHLLFFSGPGRNFCPVAYGQAETGISWPALSARR
jgi:hypothetical protein